MLSNPLIIVPFVAWLVAQTCKFVIYSYKGQFDFRHFYTSGGMPSAHTAAVMALALSAYFREGGSSPLFGLAAVVAAIVIYDSFGVRRSVGEQGKAINALAESLVAQNRLRSDDILRLREVLGHTPQEVAVGGFLGAIIAALFNIDKLQTPIGWLTTPVGKPEYIIYAILSVLILLGGWAAKFWLSRGARKSSQAYKNLRKAILIKSQTIGGVGLLLALVEYETKTYLAWRLWPVVLLIVWLVWGGWMFLRYRRTLPQILAQEADQQRKAKWLDFGKKKLKDGSKPKRRIKLPKLPKISLRKKRK